jgi:hypothetical protein
MENLLTIITGSTVFAAILIFLGKQIINKGFDTALISYENRLDLMKIEHEIRFSKLHEARALILKELYNDLYDLEKKLVYMTTLFQGPEWTRDDERRKSVVEQYQKCKDFIEVNRIFFTEEFCNDLNDNLSEAKKALDTMDDAKLKGQIHDQGIRSNSRYEFKDGEFPQDIWIRAEEQVRKKLKERRIELARSFRELMGVKK